MLVLAGCYFFISGTADILGRVLLSMGIFIEVGNSAKKMALKIA